MSNEQQAIAAVSSRVTWVLLAGIALCAVTAVLGFSLTGDNQGRVPFLNVDILPQEQELIASSGQEALTRPLFWVARRPIEPAESAEPMQPERVAPLEGVRLLGIMARDNQYTALLEVDGKVQRVGDGVDVKQWTVSELTARKITFMAGDSSAVLTMEREPHHSIQLDL